MPFSAAAFRPKLIGAFADCLFKILHLKFSVQGPRRPDENKKAGGRYAAEIFFATGDRPARSLPPHSRDGAWSWMVNKRLPWRQR